MAFVYGSTFFSSIHIVYLYSMTAVDKGELLMSALAIVAVNIFAAYRLSLAYNQQRHRIRTMVNWVCLILPVQLAIVAFFILLFVDFNASHFAAISFLGCYYTIMFMGVVIYPLAIVLNIIWYVRYRIGIKRI